MAHRRSLISGFTLIELLIVVAVVAVVLTLAAPSFSSFILMQRLKGIHAQLVTDLQYARSEAVSRGVEVHVMVQAASSGASMSCYILYTRPPGAQPCDCTATEGARCSAPSLEIRTVQIPTSQSVQVRTVNRQADNFAFDPRTGGIRIPVIDITPTYPNEFSIDTFIDDSRKLRGTVGLSGRVKVCTPTGSTIAGVPC